jgi:peptidoglycan/xylan/chitin deacetylase (PgdA/CDA1 family)
MNHWTRALLNAYYYGTLPYRWRSNTQDYAAGKAPVMVLFYHRVSDDSSNSWTMSTRMFQRQVAWLQRHVDLVSLQEAQRRIRSAHNTRPAVAITFDDGYAENCEFAIPLLIRLKIPCTYFVAVRNVTLGQPFPHDIAAGRPLPVNTVEELRTMANAGIDIELHTRSHVDLGQVVDPDQIYDEVVSAGRDLANLMDRPVRYFSFPYGMPHNLNREAFRLASQTGYLGVCSAYGGYNLPGDDEFHIQRIHADPDWIRWKNWMTFDRRKLAKVERFQYDLVEKSVRLNPLLACSCDGDRLAGGHRPKQF